MQSSTGQSEACMVLKVVNAIEHKSQVLNEFYMNKTSNQYNEKYLTTNEPIQNKQHSRT